MYAINGKNLMNKLASSRLTNWIMFRGFATQITEGKWLQYCGYVRLVFFVSCNITLLFFIRLFVFVSVIFNCSCS